ncbi:hypothetical protein G7046_g399 [Stylonectria norvegica]|nr:hypothetical protein G7046_g399 [Stylonectria norvegica]
MAPMAIDEDVQVLNGISEDVLDVCIVGAGPAGLMLADNLARFGINSKIVDERPDQTSVGRADGLQPKTIETLRMLRLADDLLRVSTKVYDICIWGSGENKPLQRMGREIHYPEDIVDVMDPYILLCHQGMVEAIFLKAMSERGVEVARGTYFEDYQTAKDRTLNIRVRADGSERVLNSRYLVGCDGAHSKVRKAIPGAVPEGNSSESVWGVLDGELTTDFPDIWSKTIIFHPQHGSVLIIPRERAMTRFYIELKSDAAPGIPAPSRITQEDVMERARQICAPYKLEWKLVEWFGRYQIGQRVANKFMDENKKVFIAGDASHTHSPKAAQGMNTSVHDSWNLAWKLNLELRGLAKPVLLESYESERRKIAQDLINFDYEHANKIAAGDSEALAENFRTNIRFISGVGVEYSQNILNTSFNAECDLIPLRPGSILPPAKAIRYIDHNPVDVQLDIPILGQFRIYVLVGNVVGSTERAFLDAFSNEVMNAASLTSQLSAAARKSYSQKPRLEGAEDVYFRHERYTTISDLFTFALITTTEKKEFEIEQLPAVLSQSPWTVYLDGASALDAQGKTCTKKWLGELKQGEVAIVNVRPDNYVGSVSKWNSAAENSGAKAAEWLDSYYDGFLHV